MIKHSMTVAAGLATSLAVILAASPVAAQMFERAYSFSGRDRASLAVIMRQVEGGMFDANNSSSGSGSSGLNYNVTNLICGGDGGSANADANSACMIMNNSSGAIGASQDSVGDQGATSDVSTTQNNQGEGSMSNALSDLSGGDSNGGGSDTQ